MATRFEGVYTAIVTPFRSNTQQIDESIFVKLLERQAKAGIDGVIIGGSTGEGQTLEFSEMKALLTVAGKFKPQMKILGACGSSSTEFTAKRFRDLAELGVDGILVSTPPYNKPPQRGLEDFFTKVLSAAPATPAIIYNVPSRTSVNLLPATLQNVWKIPNAVSVKEASGSMEQISVVAENLPAAKSLLSGDDGLNQSIWNIGGHGTVSVLSNVVPQAVVNHWKTWKSGDKEKAQKIQLSFQSLINDLFIEANPIPTKFLLAKILGVEMPLRSPLVTLDPALAPKLTAHLETIRNL